MFILPGDWLCLVQQQQRAWLRSHHILLMILIVYVRINVPIQTIKLYAVAGDSGIAWNVTSKPSLRRTPGYLSNLSQPRLHLAQ